ncbi:hypothetical protein BN873_10025 [Candidatus Competibacter denitrificans Run_A_D11]|uniref:Uncharacterized protein n=1 Tax=Candidatus Competibacter denitrificans Run_A_D11 TaxID=1400863 RepID=W6M2Q5_9GAMM|nr:hypothetical protein BN873_10025 [Candidatus Competibacter denitrificans Run_A_D11]
MLSTTSVGLSRYHRHRTFAVRAYGINDRSKAHGYDSLVKGIVLKDLGLLILPLLPQCNKKLLLRNIVA